MQCDAGVVRRETKGDSTQVTAEELDKNNHEYQVFRGYFAMSTGSYVPEDLNLRNWGKLKYSSEETCSFHYEKQTFSP